MFSKFAIYQARSDLFRVERYGREVATFDTKAKAQTYIAEREASDRLADKQESRFA